MGVYYTKKCTTLFEKVGFARHYVAIEVNPQDQALVFLNTNERVSVDAISKMKWESNLKLKMALPTETVNVKFEAANDLYAFLCDLNLDIPVTLLANGVVQSGSYSPRSHNSHGRASEVLANIMDNMRTSSRRRNSKSFDRKSSSRDSLDAALRGVVSKTY
ncbi:Aste57867_11592 [Aphanomyces stellatus]|uniref:Aste57867_11592 protein n=1 Tax=Aphanomyces stellatus TaxID=120398 RepID=A0A485KTE5_9STRA|nr:hypothetical protein As57867_011549 [Aphanomyces stellatus]VFT88451.1 Aste57867_11592 [Aphanomyces stellatus]